MLIEITSFGRRGSRLLKFDPRLIRCFSSLSHPSRLALKHWRHLRNPGWRRCWELSAQWQWCLFISRKSLHSRLSGTHRRATASSAPWHIAAWQPCQSGSCPGQIWAESDGNLCHVGWTLVNRGTLHAADGAEHLRVVTMIYPLTHHAH